MFERFSREARQVVKRSHEEAAALGSPTIEAEHLLIALAGPGSVLADAGLSRERLVAALDEEIEESLATIGFDAGPLLDQAPRAESTRPRWGQSAKLALRRCLQVAEQRGERRLGPVHLLLAVLAAEAGTVPRVLRVAGVDPDDLMAAIG